MESLFEGLHLAEVIDNNDPDKFGRVKIRPLIEGKDYNSNHLPWAKPLLKSSGGSASHGKSDIPENNSKVWITYEKFKTRKNPFYIYDGTDNNLNPYQKFDDTIKSNITGQEIPAFASSYPDVKFNLYKNGICIGASSNSTNKEFFIYHPSGSMIFINKDGKILQKSSGAINIEAGSGTIEKAILGETLKAKLESLYDEISSMLTNIQSLTVGTAMGPSTPPINTPAFVTNQANIAALKAALSQILSQLLKHN